VVETIDAMVTIGADDSQVVVIPGDGVTKSEAYAVTMVREDRCPRGKALSHR